MYVAPKVPPFQRTGAKFLVALILETLAFGLMIGFGEQSEGDRQRERIEEFTSLVGAALSSAGSSIQPLPTGALVLPELGARVGELTGEDPPKAEDVAAETTAWSAAVTRAADGIAGLQVPDEDLDPQQRLSLTDAGNLMERGLRIYAALAKEVGVAAAIDGDPQQDLIETLQEQVAIAGGMFDAGYQRLQEVRRLADLSPVTGAPGSTGISPAGVAPGGQPGFPPGIPEQPIDVVPPGGGGGGKDGGGGGNNGGGNG